MDNIQYGRGKFRASAHYVSYMNMIAESSCYQGLPNIREENGKINWQCSSGKTTSFYRLFPGRFAWWVQKADELHLPGSGKSNDRLTIAARMIHPTGKKVCLVCSAERYVGYMYMNQYLISQWNKLVGNDAFEKWTPVYEAIPILIKTLGSDMARKRILADFPEKSQDISLFDMGKYEEFFAKTQHVRTTKLSPGYMGDCPHRLDGMHDYCIFCRARHDPGRSDENLRTYNHDRRAFEWWAEGDWKVADALYHSASAGKCLNCGKATARISPDHVGPLSCGFKQNGFFDPLCSRCNSAKNRRFSFNNVIKLVNYEEVHGESVAGWQVRALWDETKREITDDASAEILSNYMRAMQDYHLRILSHIAHLGYYAFLTYFLHPEYAHFDIQFYDLNKSTLTYSRYEKTPSTSSGSRSLASRSVRIAFESLFEYCSKSSKNRKSRILKTIGQYLEVDQHAVEILFSSTVHCSIDNLLQNVITCEDMSSESKDSAIQMIIEKPEFSLRFEQYKDKFHELRALFDHRGHQLARICKHDFKHF